MTYTIEMPLPVFSNLEHTLKLNSTSNSAWYHTDEHYVEYQKPDGYYEFVKIVDEPSRQEKISKIRIISFDTRENPFIRIEIIGTLSFDRLQSLNEKVKLVN